MDWNTPAYPHINPNPQSKSHQHSAGGFCFAKIMKDYAKVFYKSKQWKDCRAAYLKSVGGLCERCLRQGLFTPGKIVHHKIHITPENIGNPLITLDWNNLELVCHNCHNEIHEHDFNRPGRKRRYVIDDDGKVITGHH